MIYLMWWLALIPYPLYLFNMKYIITESQMERALLKYFDSEFKDLTPYTNKEWKDLIFFMKDGTVIFEYHTKRSFNPYRVNVNPLVWSFLQTFFGLESPLIAHTLGDWFEDNYNMEVTGVSRYKTTNYDDVEKNYNLSK